MVGMRRSRHSSSFSRRLCRIDIAAIVAAGLVVLAGLTLSHAKATTIPGPLAPAAIVA